MKVQGWAAVQEYRSRPMTEDRRKGHELEAGMKWRRYCVPWAPTPLQPPSGLSQVWGLTVQSQVSPRDGHMTGSGNVPRAACKEWDTWRMNDLPRGSVVAEMGSPSPGWLKAQLRGVGGGQSPGHRRPLLAPLPKNSPAPRHALHWAWIQHPPVLTHQSLRGALCKPRGPSGGQ